MESLDRIRLDRSPAMKYCDPVDPVAESMGRALAYFRKVVKETDNDLVGARALEREFICDALRILSPLYTPVMESSRPPKAHPKGMKYALSVGREGSRAGGYKSPPGIRHELRLPRTLLDRAPRR